MKKFALLLLSIPGLLLFARADSVLYHATSGRDPWRNLVGITLSSTSVVHQAFVPRLDKVEVVDIGYTSQFVNPYLVGIRLQEINGLVLDMQDSPPSLAGNFDRRRIIYSNAVPVLPDSLHFLELRAAAPLLPFFNGGTIRAFTRSPTFPETFFYDGFPLAPIARTLDFGVGVFVPDILPTNEQSLVFLENDPPLHLFPNAVLTNDYITNAAYSSIEVRDLGTTLRGALAVEGVVFTSVFFEGDLVGHYGSLGGYRFSVVFNSLATPAAVQDVVRRIVYLNPGDGVQTEERHYILIYSNAVGEMSAPLHLQVLGENDPPPARLLIPTADTFWPDTNQLVAFTPPRERKTDVYLSLDQSFDPDPGGSLLFLTHRQDPGWVSESSTIKTLRRGRHQFDLMARDEQFTNTASVTLQVISTAQAVSRLKKSVRARLTDRAQRTAMLKLLSRAQTSLAHRHGSLFEARLVDFDSQTREILSASDPARQSWLRLSAHLRSEIAHR